MKPIDLRIAEQLGVRAPQVADRASRKRPGEALDAHARAPGRGNGHAAADFVRAGAGQVIDGTDVELYEGGATPRGGEPSFRQGADRELDRGLARRRQAGTGRRPLAVVCPCTNMNAMNAH
jgi:hypothetical protein